jgi:lipid A 4'-phosphatase
MTPLPASLKTKSVRETNRRFWLWHAGLPAVLVLLGTMLFRLTSLDLSISQFIFAAGGNSWEWGDHVPWKQLFDFGKIPGFLLLLTGLALLAAGFFWSDARRWRASAVFLVLVMLIGPGLVTNLLLKEHWGRPRPRQVQEFGGQYPFEPVLIYDVSSPGRSFPSGHASGAFIFVALYFVALFQGWSSRVRWSLFWAGLLFGAAMGMARILQGGHFASDVMWALAVVWLVACVCAAWILRLPGAAGENEREILHRR